MEEDTLIRVCSQRRMSPARKRLMRDFESLRQDPPAGISGAPQDSNIMLWNAVIFGPDDSPWDGGKVMLLRSRVLGSIVIISLKSILISRRMFHPNIYADGRVCLDILQNQWTPSLLCDPNTNSYANSEAALMYSENKREYNRRVRDVVEQSWD
ncbi:hypothetical protein HID58_081172 [Brassica napus]|uniref:UBC core domain-containing protein n=1 Tax=Brassica napus TaxID=3708 RepID=A0ABQ7Y724_BRANA|nr:hypothetical protein HID58_081172 [Brassica napus]